MMTTAKPGFTIVELMITLFVAGLFIVSGFQLYGVVTDRSSTARELGEASNIAYEVLRSEGTFVSTTATCTSPTNTTISRSSDTLPNIAVVLSRCRPFSELTGVIKVSVSVKYGNANPRREVVHATYVTN